MFGISTWTTKLKNRYFVIPWVVEDRPKIKIMTVMDLMMQIRMMMLIIDAVMLLTEINYSFRRLSLG